jgi:hypothetical protein
MYATWFVFCCSDTIRHPQHLYRILHTVNAQRMLLRIMTLLLPVTNPHLLGVNVNYGEILPQINSRPVVEPDPSHGLPQPTFAQRRRDDLPLHDDHQDAGAQGPDQEREFA